MSTQTAIGQQRRTQPQAPADAGHLAGAAGLIFAATLAVVRTAACRQRMMPGVAPGLGIAWPPDHLGGTAMRIRHLTRLATAAPEIARRPAGPDAGRPGAEHQS